MDLWFRTMVSWLYCFLASGEAEHHGRKYTAEQNFSLHVAQEAERKEETGVPISSSGAHPNNLTSFHQPSPLEGMTLWLCHNLLTKLSTQGLWGTFKMKTLTVEGFIIYCHQWTYHPDQKTQTKTFKQCNR